MTTEITIRTAFSTFEFIVTPDLDEATIRDAVSGYGAAFDAIDEAAIADRAVEMARRGGMITSKGTVTDAEEIEKILTEMAREEIQDRIDADVDALMARLEEARAVIAVEAAATAIEAAAAAHTAAAAHLAAAAAALAARSVDSGEAAVTAAAVAIEVAADAHTAAVAALAAVHTAAGNAQPPTRIVSDIILNEMPLHLETLEETFAALSPEQLAIFEREGQVWASSKGYLPSMNPEGENVSFILVEGVIIGRYRKSVRFGQDISFEAPLGETIPVRAGRVAMDKRLALAKTKMIETALAKAKAKFAE